MAPVARRGQILLIAAFALAVIFVALALVINTAIFTENLASQGPVTGADETRELRQEVNRSVGELLEYENRHYQYRNSTRLDSNIAALQSTLAKSAMIDGRSVSVTPVSHESGKYFADQNATGSNFTNVDNDQDWVVAEQVSKVRAVEFDLVAANESLSSTRAFQVYVSRSTAGGTESWRLQIGQDSGNPAIEVHPPSGTSEQCVLSGESYPQTLDVTGARFGGEYCPVLDDHPFASDFGTYNISFNNSRSPRIRGNYSMIVDSGAFVMPDPGVGADQYPYWQEGFYSVDVRLEVLTHDLTYEDWIRVAPGGPT